MTTPADTVSAAYERGLQEGRGPRIGTFVADTPGAPFAATTLRPIEIRTAVNEWTSAQDDHAHTSFYGARHIRLMRAYWLGRMRAAR